MSYKHKDQNSKLKEKNHKQPHWFQLFAFSFQLANQRGNVAVITALCLSVLIGMFAFVLDTGYLYGEKNRFQNAVEAAAMAGALSLCSDDPVAVARKIAQENGLPSDAVEVQVGFYDERDMYSDFGVYKDFVAEGAGDYPDDQYNNAVVVKITNDVQTLMGGFIGKDEVTVGAAAVAYLVRYGLLSMEMEDGNGIATEWRWVEGYPEFQDMGIIHANNNIDFIGPPTISENIRVTASGTISNCPEGISGVNPVDHLRPIDWEQLRSDAEANGRVISTSDFPPSGSGTIYDSDGNSYTTRRGSFWFGLHDGGHNGATYYLTDQGAPEGAVIVLTKIPLNQDINAYNFTVASDLPINFRPPDTSHGTITIGGENQDTVSIYCKNNIDGGGRFNSLSRNYFNGVFFRTERDFRVRVSSAFATHWMRVIAENKITIQGHEWQQQSAIFNGMFGPPCGTSFVRFGRL